MIVLRKSFMPKEVRMSLLDYVARTTSRLRMLQLAAVRPNCKNRYSAALPDRQRCLLSPLVEPMVRHKQPKELSDSVRKKVTKRRHRWMRIVTFQWKHRRMKSNLGLPRSCVADFRRKWREGKGKGETKERKEKSEDDFYSVCFKVIVVQGVLGFLHLLPLQKAQTAYASQRNVLPTRAR